MDILFILTGGTIDSVDAAKGMAAPHKKSAIPNFIKSLRLEDEISYAQVFMKDSRAITKKDLELLLMTIKKSAKRNIIITHGTYTMADTARYLKKNLNNNDKIIILAGSMIPLIRPQSDAPFNLGYAVAESRHLKPGVYVCMNGRIFEAGKVFKSIHEGKFKSVGK